MAEKKKNTFVSFLGWCFGFESPKKQLSQLEQPDLQISRPEPQIPDWREGEIDENGNRFWMIDYDGYGLIKHVEYVPEWVKAIWPQQTRVPLLWGITKAHPMSLNIDTTMPCVGHHYIFGSFICPEQQPPDFTLNQPQPNQLYGRQISQIKSTSRRALQRPGNGASQTLRPSLGRSTDRLQ